MARTPRTESPEATSTTTTRERRARPTPSWLTKQADLDAIARARVLMLLSVLSGETPVTTAIERLRISRGLYYQLETRALNAMLLALAPGAEGDATREGASTSRRIADLEDQVKRLEAEKRRAEQQLALTRKTIGPLPVKLARRGRPPKVRPGSTSAGAARSRGSRRKRPASEPTSAISIPMPDGEREGP